MRIIDTWKVNKNIFAYCVGENINTNFSCKKISLNGKMFDVEDVDIQISLAGNVSVTLMFNGEADKLIQPGDFKVID